MSESVTQQVTERRWREGKEREREEREREREREREGRREEKRERNQTEGETQYTDRMIVSHALQQKPTEHDTNK